MVIIRDTVSKDMSRKEEKIKIHHSAGTVEMGLWVFYFKDGDHHIAFVPSLNLTAYGDSESEAEDMLANDVLKDYMNNLLASSEAKVTQELGRYGWKRNTFFKKKFYNTPYIDEQGVLKNFNLPEETPVKSKFVAA